MRKICGKVILLALYSAALQAGAEPANSTHIMREMSLPRVQTIELPKFKSGLINLNPDINKWFILEIVGAKTQRFHLENPNPEATLTLYRSGIELQTWDGTKLACDLWTEQGEVNLETAATWEKGLAFYSLCGGKLYLRIARNSETKLSATEWTTEMLRQTDFGEKVINAFKPVIVNFESETAKTLTDSNKTGLDKDLAKDANPDFPLSAQMAPGGLQIAGENDLGFSIRDDVKEMRYGIWYETKMHSGIFVSMFVAKFLHEKFKAEDPLLYPLEEQELDKMIYVVAYDLDAYTANYVVGTEQPGINLEEDAYGSMNNFRKALVPIGSIPPYDIASSVGVFIGGFKQMHSMMRSGALKGKSYGYIQNGVELSPMDSGLATIYSDKDGEVEIGNWPEDEQEQRRLRKVVTSARQNGVLLLDNGKPGEYIKDWRAGNWSADARGLRRSLRSGICIAKRDERKFLQFFAFTAATPSAMARVMQAYYCNSALHLDMNAMMYLHNAIYSVLPEGKIEVEYLDKEMLYPPGLKTHRFIMDNNYRDFFYIKKLEPKTPQPGPILKPKARRK